MKSRLVKRLESSKYAFEKTLERSIASHEKFIAMFNSGTVYISNDFDVLDYVEDDEINIEDLMDKGENKNWEDIPSFNFSSDFLPMVKNDLALLKEILSDWQKIKHDFKQEKFVKEIKENALLENKKIVVFTESAETGENLAEALNKIYPGKVLFYSSSKNESIKETIKNNYDPNIKDCYKKNDIQILITTDVLAEGINLHRSNIIVNYDLPWNPTRVMQRTGRINRVGTEYDKIYIFNFFPTSETDNVLKLKESIIAKIQAFHNALGEDAKYLSDDEEVESFNLSGQRLYEALSSKASFDDEEENPQLKYLKLIKEIRKNKPELYVKIADLPKKIRTARHCGNNPQPADKLITFFRKGKLCVFCLTDGAETKNIPFIEAIKYFECEENEPQKNIPQKYYEYIVRNKDLFGRPIETEPMRQGGHSNKDTVIKTLRSLMNVAQYTNEDKLYIQSVINALADMVIPENISKQLSDYFKKTDGNFISILLKIKEIVPEPYSEQQTDDKRQAERKKRSGFVRICLFTGGIMQKLISETFNNSYKEEQFRSFIDALLYGADFKKAQQISLLPPDFKDFIRSAKRICKYEYDENGISKTIDVLAIKLKRHSSVERARAAQRNFVARYLNGSRNAQKDAALVAFLYEDEKGNISPDWRFSFVQMTYKTEFVQTETGIKINSKTELTPAKRFSFLVGENEHTHTAQQQLKSCLEKAKNKTKITIEDLSAAFDIEKVSDEFFEKYKELFQKLADEIKRLYEADKNIKKDFNAHNINIEDFAKKTLGQLVFLYFIQKKGWLGVKQGQQWGSGDKKFLRNAFDKKYRGYENFFNDILEHLFYEALAKDRTANNDCFALLNCRIPFLNGGLFEPVNGYEWQNTNLAIDNAIFKEIFDVFDLYNFTVKEDEPLEKEVAIDPEMLGKVFENLLPENIRKGNGAYYTPRPVVYYMCQESLISCLDNKVNSHKEIIPRQDIESLIRTGTSVYKNKTRNIAVELPQSIKDNAKELDRVLAEIKICDPAIGSGAFPVGIMNELVRARAALSEYIGQPERTTYELKRNAVENCIYGVDLDGGAVEIAKLRLWLSLVVDEENISEIKPLPNLDYKIMQGNSLISSYEGIDFDDIAAREQKNQFSLFAGDSKNIIQQLTEKQRQLLNSPGDKGKAIKQEIEDLIVRLVKEYYQEKAQLECRLINFYEDKIRDFAQNREKRNFFPWKLFFADVFANGGFDIVIANPPYVEARSSDFSEDLKDKLQKVIQKYYSKNNQKAFPKGADLLIFFFELSFRLLKMNGINTFITENSWLSTDYGRKFQDYLLDNINVQGIIDSDYKYFENADINTVISFFKKKKQMINFLFSFFIVMRI
ncbi:MAG: N-6 DNA methylase [Elusimicrobiales bacterium]|nr:N-6 DNA methylase [Elusimicrobiales bacterium]